MRIIVILFLLAIIGSLASALVFFYRDRDQGSHRMFRALALRVGLSVVLFLMLCAAYYFGGVHTRL